MPNIVGPVRHPLIGDIIGKKAVHGQIEIPFNAPTDRPCKLWHQTGGKVKEIKLKKTNQYTLQGEYFCQAILEDTEVPTPFEDAIANMKAIDAVFESDRVGGWVKL